MYNERGEKTVYLKMVGCLGIVAATSGYGYSRGMEYQRQITDTGELQRVIRQLAGEMEYTYAPLARVCASVSRRCSQNYRIWFGTSGKRIGDAVKKSCNNLGEVLRK
ncbi:MAG: stage III sporulation protein AB [Coprococcus sp.]